MQEQTSREIRSTLTTDGDIEISIASVPKPIPAENEVLIRVEASPINPSDLGVLLASANPKTLKKEKANFPKVSMDIDTSSSNGLNEAKNRPIYAGWE